MSLKVTDLQFSYGSRPVLSGINFEIEAGRFCALLGPNGAGKSTLFALLTRLFVSPSGQIMVAGQNLADKPGKALAQIGVVFQQSTLDSDLSILQNMRYFAALHGIAGKRALIRIGAVLEQMEIAERQDERVRDLNGGHRRRAEIARSLIHEPAVLMLDEPTIGLDAGSRSSLTRHVHDLCKTQGVTVLWATHLTDEIWPEDQLIILHKGQVLENGVTSEITAGEDLRDVFLARTRDEEAQP